MNDGNHEIWACSCELHGIAELMAHLGEGIATDQAAMNGLGLILERISKRLMRLYVHLDKAQVAHKGRLK